MRFSIVLYFQFGIVSLMFHFTLFFIQRVLKGCDKYFQISIEFFYVFVSNIYDYVNFMYYYFYIYIYWGRKFKYFQDFPLSSVLHVTVFLFDFCDSILIFGFSSNMNNTSRYCEHGVISLQSSSDREEEILRWKINLSFLKYSCMKNRDFPRYILQHNIDFEQTENELNHS